MTPEKADSIAREVFGPLRWLTEKETSQVLEWVWAMLEEKRRREDRQRRTYG